MNIIKKIAAGAPAFVFGAVLAGCGAAPVSNSGFDTSEITVPPKYAPLYDDEHLNLAYDPNYRYPAGFYKEDLAGSGYSAAYYENTVSVRRESVWIELHTADIEEARKWSNLSNENSSVRRNLISERETEKYYEFLRRNKSENVDFYSRVHRSDYFIPLFDKSKSMDTIGIYNGDLAIGKVKELVEYLWAVSLNMFDKAVKSSISEKDGVYECDIQSLRIVYGDWGLHDMIYVYDEKFIFDKETRILVLAERKLVKEITGKYNAGGVIICDACS